RPAGKDDQHLLFDDRARSSRWFRRLAGGLVKISSDAVACRARVMRKMRLRPAGEQRALPGMRSGDCGCRRLRTVPRARNQLGPQIGFAPMRTFAIACM